MTRLSVQYYAILREQAGLSVETLDTTASTAAELYEELAVRHAFTLPRSVMQVAVNGEFAAWTAALRDADRVVFIPPVAGG